MSHQAFLFDIDDTLFNSTQLSTLARARAIDAMIEAGLHFDHDTVAAQLREVLADFGSNYQYHYDVLLKRLGLRAEPRLIAAGTVAYHDVKRAFLAPFEETVPTLLRLREQGRKLGVVTNGQTVKQWEKLIRLGLQHFFDSVVISEDVGVGKPHARIFQLACGQLGVAPAAAVYVGNEPEKDIRGAQAAGLTPVFMRRGKYADQAVPADLGPVIEIRGLHDLLPLIAAGKL